MYLGGGGRGEGGQNAPSACEILGFTFHDMLDIILRLHENLLSEDKKFQNGLGDMPSVMACGCSTLLIIVHPPPLFKKSNPPLECAACLIN